jgi:hypothetical protein
VYLDSLEARQALKLTIPQLDHALVGMAMRRVAARQHACLYALKLSAVFALSTTAHVRFLLSTTPMALSSAGS